MTAWILSIVGIVFVGIIFDMIRPEGKLSTFIKSIFAIITLFVIVSPIPKLLQKKWNWDWDFEWSDEYLQSVTTGKVLYYQDQIRQNLENMGYQQVDVLIKWNQENSTQNMEKIYIDFTKYVLNGGDKHKIEYEKIEEMIVKLINIEKENIIFYG